MEDNDIELAVIVDDNEENIIHGKEFILIEQSKLGVIILICVVLIAVILAVLCFLRRYKSKPPGIEKIKSSSE